MSRTIEDVEKLWTGACAQTMAWMQRAVEAERRARDAGPVASALNEELQRTRAELEQVRANIEQETQRRWEEKVATLKFQHDQTQRDRAERLEAELKRLEERLRELGTERLDALQLLGVSPNETTTLGMVPDLIRKLDAELDQARDERSAALTERKDLSAALDRVASERETQRTLANEARGLLEKARLDCEALRVERDGLLERVRSLEGMNKKLRELSSAAGVERWTQRADGTVERSDGSRKGVEL